MFSGVGSILPTLETRPLLAVQICLRDGPPFRINGD
jgi:hypothetical protein